MAALAVVNIRQLVTVAGPARPRVGPELRELGIIDDAVLVVRDGRVASAWRAGSARIPEDAEIVDAGGRIVLPGFVDAHTHPVFAGTRADEYERRIAGETYAQIAEEGGGIRSTVRLTRAASEVDLAARAARYAGWFLRGGTTTIEAKSGYGLSLEAELKILRVIRQLAPLRTVATFLGAHEVPDEFRSNRAGYVDAVIHEMLPRVASGRLAEFCDVFCEPNVFGVEESRAVLAAAQGHGLGIRMHADQFTADFATPLAAEFHAATADHLEATTEAGLRALLDAEVQPVLLPASVYALSLRHYPAARKMIELGMPIVLASDFNPGTSPTASMPMVLSLACSQLRLSPAEGIVAATINAAYSLRRGDSIGSLEAGKLADFAIHNCDDYREIPYFFGRETAHAVYIGGERVNLLSSF